MAAQVDRMAVNAAIEDLVSGKADDWEKAAQEIVDYGRLIDEFDESSSVFVAFGGSEPPVSGFAVGVGNVDLKEEGSDAEVVRWFRHGRVGKFCLVNRSKKRVIEFCEYRGEIDFAARAFTTGHIDWYGVEYDADFQVLCFYERRDVLSPAPWYMKLDAHLLTLSRWIGKMLSQGRILPFIPTRSMQARREKMTILARRDSQ